MKKYLLSYPRSGSNWLCYIIEFLTDSSVVGNTDEYKIAVEGIRKQKSKIIEKVHGQHKEWWRTIDQREDALIFIIRDFKECVVRHNDSTELEILKFDLHNINPLSSGVEKSDYLSLLDLYASWEGSKHLIYYEDLITQPQTTIQKFLGFLRLNNINRNGDLQQFIEDLQFHKNKSLTLYESEIAISVTKGDDIHHHSKTLSQQQVNDLNIFIKDKAPHLIKYLSRYIS